MEQGNFIDFHHLIYRNIIYMPRITRKPMVKNKLGKYKLGKYKSAKYKLGKYKITKKGVRKTRHTKKRYTRKIGGDGSSLREEDYVLNDNVLEESTTDVPVDIDVDEPLPHKFLLNRDSIDRSTNKNSSFIRFLAQNAPNDEISILYDPVDELDIKQLREKYLPNFETLLKSPVDKEQLLGLFIKLSISIENTGYYKKTLDTLQSQYNRKLMTHEDYEKRITGLKIANQKFIKLVTNIITRQLYYPLNSKNKHPIPLDNLADWAEAFETVINFNKSQYENFLVVENTNTKTKLEVLKEIDKYCDETKSENEKCEYPNPCCTTNKTKKKNFIERFFTKSDFKTKRELINYLNHKYPDKPVVERDILANEIIKKTGKQIGVDLTKKDVNNFINN